MKKTYEDREASLLRQLRDPRAQLRGMADPSLAPRLATRPLPQVSVLVASPDLTYVLTNRKIYL